MREASSSHLTVVHFHDCKVSLGEGTLRLIHDQLLALADKPSVEGLRLDFGDVEYVNAATLGMLVDLHKKLADMGRCLTICNLTAQVYEVFVVTALDKLLDLHRKATLPNILVVDDDPDTCRNMTDLFEDLGFAVEATESGARALESAQKRPYDIALLDVRMRGMDGLTLCRRLRQLQPLMAIIIVSADAGSDMESHALGSGAHFVVTKPIDFPRLLSLVEEALGR
jgi:anti-anti-sigma factor